MAGQASRDIQVESLNGPIGGVESNKNGVCTCGPPVLDIRVGVTMPPMLSVTLEGAVVETGDGPTGLPDKEELVSTWVFECKENRQLQRSSAPKVYAFHQARNTVNIYMADKSSVSNQNVNLTAVFKDAGL
eukprot:2783094-Karenia_brevis.AAC.1